MKLTRPTIPSLSAFPGKLLMLHLIAGVFLITPCLHAQRTINKSGGNQQNLISTEFNNRTEWRLVIAPYKQGNPDKQNSVPIKAGERVSVSSPEGTRYGIFRGNDRIDHYVVERRNKPYVILPPQTGGSPPAPPAPTQPVTATNTVPTPPTPPAMPPVPPAPSIGQPAMPPAPGSGGTTQPLPGTSNEKGDRPPAPNPVVERDTDYERWLSRHQNPRRTKKESRTDYASAESVGEIGHFTALYSGYNIKTMDPVFLSRNRGGDNHSVIFRELINSSRDWHLSHSNHRLPLFVDWNDVGAGFSERQAQKSVFFSSAERSETFEVNATTPSGFSGGYSHSESEMERRDSISIVSSEWATSGWMTLDKRHVILHSEFIKAVQKLGSGYNEHVAFFEQFGTHYPISTLYGGLKYSQQYIESEEAASRLQKGWKAGYERKAQVEAGPVSAEVTTSLGFSSTTTTASASGSSFDSAGEIAYGTLATGGRMEPIKVQLDPITELILPTLFGSASAAEMQAIKQKRATMESHLRTYLTPTDITVKSRTPRIFEMRVTRVTLIEEDDGLNPAPELHEHIYIIGRKTDGNLKKEVSSANVWRKEVADRVTVKKNESLKLNSHVARTVIFPEAVKEPNGNWGADYQTSKYEFEIHVNLFEHDDTGRDYITGGRVVKLDDLAKSGKSPGSPLSGSFDAKGAGAGTVRVQYELKEVPFAKVMNPPLNLPPFPIKFTTP